MTIFHEIEGMIDHRVLINFRIEPAALQRHLPPGFRPKLVKGFAIGGICQVSLSHMRPRGLPAAAGGCSRNTAHRAAVLSEQGEGVFIFSRETDSRLNALAGGRLFPGDHHRADFAVQVEEGRYRIRAQSTDRRPLLEIDAELAGSLPCGSLFSNLDEISEFFRRGNLGWSRRRKEDSLDTIELAPDIWRIEPLKVSRCFSVVFSNPLLFPEGTAEFDSAAIMRNIPHRWISRGELHCPPGGGILALPQERLPRPAPYGILDG